MIIWKILKDRMKQQTKQRMTTVYELQLTVFYILFKKKPKNPV
ncbi:hypothetical protein P278_15060 [Zhouia amylolytica AD3]|uniref:Uncharacterized protein n=1 Tax=Zhouia amylolytica AD3 TaxID=1286632 RepID=W2UPD3_9FLAO|nr:hypothetical protein P278_15060 [Zhouia amylolytica AD3]